MDDSDRNRSGRSSETYRRRTERSDVAPTSERDVTSTRKPNRVQRVQVEQDLYQEYDPEESPTRESRSDMEERPARYSDRFRRSNRAESQFNEAYDTSYRFSRDPYDRLRRVSSRPARRVEVSDEIDEYGYLEDEYDDRQPGPAPRRRTSTSRSQPSRTMAVSRSLTHPAAEMRPLFVGGIAALASLLLLSILILVRSGSADAWLPMHLDAEGTATEYGSISAIWRLPFFALMTTFMAFGLGWWLRVREAFATQYLIVGALLVHGLIWVGTITLLW